LPNASIRCQQPVTIWRISWTRCAPAASPAPASTSPTRNRIITPHVAASSDRVFGRLLTVAQDNLRRYVAGEKMLSVVDPQRGY